MKRFMLFVLTVLLTFSFCSTAFASSEAVSAELPTEIPESAETRITANLYLDGTSDVQDAYGCIFTATADEQSCVYAKNGARYTINGAVFTKPTGILTTATSFVVPTGEVLWSTTEAGSYGINAVVLAWGDDTVLELSNCSIWTYNTDKDGNAIADDERLIGANAAFATMNGKLILNNVDIIAAGEGGHGLDVTSGGVIEINDSSIITYGKKASGLTTDQPGGDIYATNVDVLTYKSGSAPIYCDGNSYVTLDGGSLESWIEPAAVVCTDGVLDLTGVNLLSHGDAALNAHFPNSPSTITCVDCCLTSEVTSAVTSYAATNMFFENCDFHPADGAYIFASIPGENSSGGISADEATVTMRDCELSGGIWADEDNGASVNLILENSEWIVTTESVLTTFTLDDASSVTGIMTVDGTACDILPGSYENVVILPA